MVLFGSVWFCWTHLVDDVDSVVELLPLQNRVKVVEPELEVFVSLTERDDDGDLLQRHAVLGSEPAAGKDVGVVPLDLLQANWDVELHPEGANWGRRHSINTLQLLDL